mgnify:CR=1 FL=1
MIISHKYKYIFIAVPKTGTHAVRNILRPHMEEGDLEQVDLFEKKRLPWYQLALKQHGHIKAGEIRQFFDKSLWKTYYKFAFVRNPWDRFISLAFFIGRNSTDFKKDPTGFLHSIADNDHLFLNRILFRPQYEFVMERKKVMTDFTGRYENFQEDFNRICHKTGIPPETLPIINTTDHKHYREYYDETLKEKVFKRYKGDVEAFGYGF